MPRHNLHPQSGSDPESTFDHWLDGLVTGTPGAEPWRNDRPMGLLTQAQSGARQLHELAAQAAMASGATSARQRIKENLMHNGVLVGSGGGASWIPPRTHDRQSPWWSLTSPVIAGALIFALIVSMAGALVLTQRPDPSPTPTDAPGFAVASPDGTQEATSSDLFIIDGVSVTTDANNALGTLDDNGLTLPTTNGETVTIPDVVRADRTGEPGQALITREDRSRAVVDLSTGDVLSDIPAFGTWGRDYSSHQFLPANDELTDWTIVDMRTGDTRLLSEAINLPGGTGVMPSSIDVTEIVGDARVFRLELGEVDGVDFNVIDPAGRTFVIAGSLARIAPLPDFPTAREQTDTPQLVTSDDGNTVAYETRAGDDRIIVLDTTTSKVLMRVGASSVGDDPTLVGFTDDGQLVASASDTLVTLNPNAINQTTVVADGFESIDNPLLYAPLDLVYVRQVDTLLQVDLASGEVREVAAGLLPGTFGFTREGSDWITFETQDGQALLDARTGDVVSQMQGPGGVGQLDALLTDEQGDTFIFAAETGPPPPGAEPSPPTVWLLSPEFPDGLELTAPEAVQMLTISQSGFLLSQDGSTLYAFTSERGSGPVDIWMTPLSTEPDWQIIAEEVEVVGYFPLGGPDAIADGSRDEAETLPAQDFATPEATPAIRELDALLPTNAVPVFNSGPIDQLSPDRYGAVSDDGLTISLRNGEIVTLPDAVRVSQVLHADIAIVVDADDSRRSIDLTDGETLVELYPPGNNEQIVGLYQFTPANDDLTDWRILDLRTGEETSTSEISGGPFDQEVSAIQIGGSLNSPDHALAQFVVPSSTGDFIPWQGQATDEGPASGTLVIPGELADTRFIEGSVGSNDPWRATTALLANDEPLVAYVTAEGDERVVVEHAVTGEQVATWSDQMLMARDGTTYVSGFSPDGTSLTTWSADSPQGGDDVATLSWPDGEAETQSFESDDGRISIVIPSETSALVMMTEQIGTDTGPAIWKHLDLESGEWTDLPELNGFQWDRGYPESAWMVLNQGVGPGSSTVIIDKTSGEIAARLDDPDLGMSTGRSPTRDLSALAITGHTGEPESTGYVLDANSGESWQITPPEVDGTIPPGIFFGISPDGSMLVASSYDPLGGDIETWVSPVQLEPDWTSIGPRSIDTWLYFPDDDS